ncbi:MAG TPA: hypothetical protein VLL52_07380 [Anaerolineae bacterium]|nr:hypothetical protein [Anaerolineae bacterium]
MSKDNQVNDNSLNAQPVDKSMNRNTILERVLSLLLEDKPLTPYLQDQLKQDDTLRHMYYDAINALHMPPEALPHLPPPDLTFLPTKQTAVDKIKAHITSLTAQWDLAASYLQPTLQLTPNWRQNNLLSNTTIPLLEANFELNEIAWEMSLDATLQNVGEVTLFLIAVPLDTPLLPPIQATINWGTYQATTPLDQYGQATFPSLRLADVTPANLNVKLALVEK